MKLDASTAEGSTDALPVVADGQYHHSGPLPVVADRPASGAVLVVHKGPDQGARFVLNSDIVRIGRSPDCDVFLDDVTVSRHHAELLHGHEGWLLRDKGSLNGTYVNRSLVDEWRLRGGEEVQIGKYRFLFWAAE